MNELNHLYVKVQDFISEAKDIKELQPIVKKIGRLTPKDTFTRIKNEIIIEDDWISYAEARMKYVEAAVYENRQFIREDGEVLPIERVKKISRTSVEHLARHSDYIEKYNPEEDELVPGKIYTVNKDTDYGVYENKFLYLLLMTLSDFINREREEISTSLKQETGSFSIVRQNEIDDDDVSLEIRMTFRTADSETKMKEAEQKKLIRMEDLRGRVAALLSTSLMQVVSREPMISSQITKTNVLTMNENFSNSLDLFEFLINYDKEPYSCKRVVEPITVKSEFSYPILALELLVQAFKNDMVKEYDHQMKEIKSSMRQKALDEMTRRIEELKEQYKDNPYAYVVVLEDKLNLMGELNVEIADLRQEILVLTKSNAALSKDKEQLEARVTELNAKISELTIRIEGFEEEKKDAISEYIKKLDAKDAEIEALKETIAEKDSLIQKAQAERQEATQRAIALDERVTALLEERNALEKAIEAEKALNAEELKKRDEELQFLRGRFTGIQAAAGEINPEDAETSKEAFDELEMEYNAFTEYFEAVWKRTQKEIKKEIKRKRG